MARCDRPRQPYAGGVRGPGAGRRGGAARGGGDAGNTAADIEIVKNKAYIKGVETLTGTVVEAEELRGGAALAVAGMAAVGRTVIKNRHFIERGYENICRDLRELGADISIG